MTGAPLPHQMTVHVQDSIDPTSDDGPPTPGDDDDDDDDKDRVWASHNFTFPLKETKVK